MYKALKRHEVLLDTLYYLDGQDVRKYFTKTRNCSSHAIGFLDIY